MTPDFIHELTSDSAGVDTSIVWQPRTNMIRRSSKKLSSTWALSLLLSACISNWALGAGYWVGSAWPGRVQYGFESALQAAKWACGASVSPYHLDPDIRCEPTPILWPGTNPNNVPPLANGWTSYYTPFYYTKNEGGRLAAGSPIGYHHTPSPAKNTCNESDKQKRGNPINVGTGAKSCVPENDFPGGELPFIRNYSTSTTGFYNRDLGYSWSGSYLQRISFGQEGQWQLAVVRRPSGQEFSFERTQSSPSWVSESDVNYRLTTSAWTPTNFELRTPEGDLEIYDANGRLQQVRQLNGRILTMSYSTGGQLTAVTNDSGRWLRFTYYPAISTTGVDNIATITDASGRTVAYTYDQQNNLASVTYGDGSIRRYHYNEPANTGGTSLPNSMTGITDETNTRYAIYKYDSTGRAVSTELAGGANKFTVNYQSPNSISRVVDPHGVERTYRFATHQGVTKTTNITEPCASCPGGTSAANMQHDAQGNLVNSTDANNNATSYVFDLSRNLETSRTEASTSTTFKRTTNTTWHPTFRLPIEIKALNNVNALVQRTVWVYNSRGQAIATCQIEPNDTAAMAYGCGSSTSPPAGVRQTLTQYCEANDVAQLGNSCPILGLTKSIDGPLPGTTDSTSFLYQSNDPPGCLPDSINCSSRKGDLRRVTNALGHTKDFLEYDGAGRVLRTQDSNGVITHFEYDARGRLIARKVRGSNNAAETDDQITRMEYWPNGLVKKVTQANGAFTSYSYDGAQRLVGIADNAGNSMTYTLNAAGERIKEDTKDSSGALMRTLARTYNLLGQLQAQTDAYNRSTTFSYDANSNLDATTDPLTRVSDNNYDPLNRLSRTLQDVSGIAAETKFSYDALDNLTQVNDPKGLNTTYSYNGLSDLTQLSSPDTGTTSYLYDSAGNRTRQTDARGVVTNFSYDALNRLISITYPTASLNTAYQYDADASGDCNGFGEGFLTGRLVQITDGSGSTKYCYDRFGNVTRKIQTTNGKVFTLLYSYNVAGQLATLTYPDGAVVDYLYDGQGRVREIGAKTATGARQIVLNSTSYYAFGPVKQWSFGNARLMKRSLNLNYQPSAIEASAGGLSLGYEFDAVGNLAKLNDLPPATTTKRQYAYDGLNRLLETKDANNAVQQAYSYDKTGNRISTTVSGTSSSYSYGTNNHRLSGVGSVARSYDNAGNTTQIANATAKNFVYADHGRMTQYREGTTLKMSYAYNGRGEQVRKFASSTTNVYSVYDNDGRWLGDYNNAGTSTQQIIWFGDLPVALWNGATTAQKLHYIEADALGTPRAVVDPTRGAVGTVVWSWDLTGEAFGTTAPNQNPDGDAASFVFNMRFPGQRFDSVSGLNYNYFRDYEASTGRYVESDPIGLSGGPTTYTYSGSSPMQNIDSKGLKWVIGGQNISEGNEAVIICKGGKVSVLFSGYNDMGCSEILEAAKRHEQSHVKDIDPTVCNCQADNMYISNDNKSDLRDSERRAFGAELEFLNRAISRTKGRCKPFIQARIDDINNRLLPCVNSGNYQNCR
jgi:RHS repeat-associated protein